MEARYTAWHYFLADAMQHLIDDSLLQVLPFEKLGTLPLEADIILLRRQADLDLAALYPEFDFLLRHLALYPVVEYKSPADRLTREDLDTVRAYAMLCKRKFGIGSDRDVRIALLYSHTERGFFKSAKQDHGLVFRKIETGIRQCNAGNLTLFAMNLVELGKERPGHLLNLFSSRHGKLAFGQDVSPKVLGVIQHVYECLFKRRNMKHEDVKNLPGFTRDMNEIRRRLLQGYSTEERLEGISPEKRLEGLSPEKRLEGLSPEEIRRRLSPEEWLEGLSSEEMDRLRKILEQKRH